MFYAVAASLIAASVAIAIIGLASRNGTLERNWFAGTRTPATMRDDTSWAVAQKTGWKLYFVNAALLFVSGVGLIILVLTGSSDEIIAVWVLFWAGCVVAVAVIQAIRSNNAAKRAE
ncbi:SdpI family protein [Brevibacterium otitidis]|uniref:SdpI family protein n=1 Tax=Brevibacterium otitidis TaxID=53364 RepID=A0ABV5WXQ7_9MICO|nr:hypothetical protein GCM10023233_20030 [Brevibacterium otitidis]